MNAHPQLSKENAAIIVKYILSLTQQKTYDSLPATGTASIKPPAGTTGGTWSLTAAYTDLGNGVVPLTSSKQLVLRQPTIQANEADLLSGIERFNNMLGALKNRSYFVLKGIDLKGIKQVTYNYAAKENAAMIEIHIDSVKGPVISTLNYQPTGNWDKLKQASTSVTETAGIHDLYFVFRKDGEVLGEGLCLLDWLRFAK